MTPEDRTGNKLRDLLRNEASTIVPAGDGLARIRERISRRRRARLWVVPSAALATAAAVGAFFLLTPDDRRTATLNPAQTPSAAATAQPTVSSSPIPVVADDGGMPLTGPAIWPFTTQAQAASWRTSYPFAQDGLEVARRFVTEFLGLHDVEVSQNCVSCGVLQLRAGGRSAGQVVLSEFGVGFASGHGTHLWTVAGVGGTDLVVSSPKPGDAITSPTRVTGRINGVHENVALRLLAESGDELAAAGAPAGGSAPWTASLDWSSTQWTSGAIVGVTRSDKDGTTTRVVAVPVTRATSSAGTATSSFAAIVDGHVALFDAGSGTQQRQLTFPPSGKSDTAATWSAGTLAWVRTAGASACVYELDRLVTGGKASTVASSTSVRYGSPELSPDARTLGWVETPCAGGRESLVLHSGGKVAHRFAGPSGTTMSLLDIADDGTLLLLTNDAQATGPGTIGVLPAGATSLDALRPLRQAAGCNLASGAAFRSGTVVAFESCGEDLRLARFSLSGARSGADASMKGEPPQSISVRGGNVLAQLFGGDTYGSIATYANGRFTRIISNDSPSCTSVGSGKGCVSSPDW